MLRHGTGALKDIPAFLGSLHGITHGVSCQFEYASFYQKNGTRCFGEMLETGVQMLASSLFLLCNIYGEEDSLGS